MNLYSYDGPVMKFDMQISKRWYGQTYAKSERKARSNLAYQYKKEHGFQPNVKISLPGKIVLEKENEDGRLQTKLI